MKAISKKRKASKSQSVQEFTPKKASKKAFLEAYALTCSVTGAAKRIGISRQCHYDWLASDAGYKTKFADVQEQAIQTLEDEAVRRAHEGVERATTVAGKKEITREYSDTLLIFLLKGLRPEKYRERSEVKLQGLADLGERLAAGRQRAAARKEANGPSQE